eukprot:5819597-Amphidinium_carterae.2
MGTMLVIAQARVSECAVYQAQYASCKRPKVTELKYFKPRAVDELISEEVSDLRKIFNIYASESSHDIQLHEVGKIFSTMVKVGDNLHVSTWA